jgi:hypothetical protein
MQGTFIGSATLRGIYTFLSAVRLKFSVLQLLAKNYSLTKFPMNFQRGQERSIRIQYIVRRSVEGKSAIAREHPVIK